MSSDPNDPDRDDNGGGSGDDDDDRTEYHIKHKNFDKVYSKLAVWLLVLIRRELRDKGCSSHTDDLDILNEIFLKLMAKPERFEDRGNSSFRKWVSKCAKNEIGLLARKKKEHFTSFTTTSLGATIIGPHEMTVISEHAEAVEEALKRFEKVEVDIYLDKIHKGCTYKELVEKYSSKKYGFRKIGLSQRLLRIVKKIEKAVENVRHE